MRRKKPIIIFIISIILAVSFGAIFGVQKAYAGRGNYYEQGDDGRIYYHGEGNDPTIQMIITPLPKK